MYLIESLFFEHLGPYNTMFLLHPECVQGGLKDDAGYRMGANRFTGCWEGKESRWGSEWEEVSSTPKQLQIQNHHWGHVPGVG